MIGYENSFWGADFTSTAGFDALVRRMEEGRTCSKIIGEFFKSRAKTEEDYGKSLLKICRCVPDLSDSGWDVMKTQTENMAQTHLDSSTYFLELSNKITEFLKNQKMDRKNKEDYISSLAKDKITYLKKNADAKKLYENRSLEAELADNTLKKAKTNENSYPTKEWDKIVKKAAKAIEDAAAADKSYKDLVMKLEETRKLWEKEMKEYCIMCEQMDESRLKFLMENVWAAVNVVSKNCLDIDNGCEVIRQSIENISIDGDMKMFVSRCQTGSDKPAPIRYEPYRSQYSSSARI